MAAGENIVTQPMGAEAMDPVVGLQPMAPEALQPTTAESGSRVRNVGRVLVEAAIAAVPFGANLATITGLRGGLGLAQRGVMHMGTSSGDQDLPW